MITPPSGWWATWRFHPFKGRGGAGQHTETYFQACCHPLFSRATPRFADKDNCRNGDRPGYYIEEQLKVD